MKKHTRFQWTDRHQKAFEDIKQLLVKQPLYQWQDNEWVLVLYDSKRLPDAVRNYGVTKLELTGLLANIHGFDEKLMNNYFEVIVNHKAIDYVKKSRHEPTSTRLATLLGRLIKYTFDLKYLEGNKLKVSEVLSRLYIEEKHKINDVIPLNFLLHFTDHQFLKQYTMHLANRIYTHIQTKNPTQTRPNYDRKVKNMVLKRYQMPIIEKKTRCQPPGASKTAQLPIMSPNTKSEPPMAVDKAIAILKLVIKTHYKKMKL